LFFPCKQPKSGFSPLLRPTEDLSVETRPTRGLMLPRSRGCAAAARAARGCALLRAAVRGRVVARGREPRPWLRPGVQLEEREREWEGGGDLGFGERKVSFFFTERRGNSPSDLNVRERTLCIEAPMILIINKVTHPPNCHLAKARIKMILALDPTSPCTPNPFHQLQIKNYIYHVLVRYTLIWEYF